MAGCGAHRLSLALAGLLCAAAAAVARDGGGPHAPDAPDFALIRHEEDYRFLAARPRQALTAWERLKHWPLDAGSTASISLGGELRTRWEFQRNPDFGAERRYSSVYLQRATLGADLRLGPLRLYGQLLHAVQSGRPGGPSPVDENRLDVQNAFADIAPGPIAGVSTLARLGRQEMRFGSGRLVDPREGPNVRRTFDGGRMMLRRGRWTLDAVLVRPRADRDGVFDDRTNGDERLAGAYAVGRDLWPGGTLDLYVLEFEDETARFVQGADRERRVSAGTRASGSWGAWDYNWEVVWQFGSFGGDSIRAWTVATETGYSFASAPGKPRLALNANVASGDSDPDDRSLGTFNPLYPRGNYFSEDATLGPRNFFNLHPFLTVQLADTVSLTADVNFFWRLETADGVYTPSGAILRRPVPGAGRYVGTAASANLSWRISPFVDAAAIYTRFEPGAFLKDTGASKPLDFVEITLRARF